MVITYLGIIGLHRDFLQEILYLIYRKLSPRQVLFKCYI